jgi:serine protease Do
MRKTWIVGLVAALIVGAGITLAWMESTDRRLAVGPTVALAQENTSTDSTLLNQSITDSGHAAIKQAIATVGPAVVRIDVTGTVTLSNPFLDFYDNPMFRRFFGDPFDLGPQERTMRSLGSGLVIEYEGEKLVLTNAHVVADADAISVTDINGTTWDAAVVGADDVLDVAVLRLNGDAEGLPTAELGDSDDVEIGDWAIAIGNPLGLSYTVTLGIISATDRDIAKPSGVGNFNNLIQTDAAINPGNSGGPLVNAFGQVIGLNTMIARGTSNGVTVEGINFAIAINGVKDVLAPLVELGKVRRGWLGVQHTEITPQTAEEYGIHPDQTGTLVVYVFPGEPADLAGIRVGDVVLRVGETLIGEADDLNREIGRLAAGSAVDIVVLRGDEELTLTAVLGERPSEAELAAYERNAPESEELQPASGFGIAVGPITPIVAQHLGLNSTDGVVIMEVAAGSRADRAGLTEGDVILEVDHRPIESIEAWNTVISELDGDAQITLTVLRNGRLGFVTIE